MSKIQPQRIQRKRTPGFRMQEISRALNGLPARSVARRGIFGNPFTIEEYGDGAFMLHRLWLTDKTMPMSDELRERRDEVLRRLPELRGKNLACFCSEGMKCHGDTLIELANK